MATEQGTSAEQRNQSQAEEWKPVVDCDGFYEVSSFGRVRSVVRDLILKPHRNNKGYLVIDLNRGGRRKKLVHRLVAEAFIFNQDLLPEVNHKDGNKSNCHADNLEWATRLSNVAHAVENGLNAKGESHGGAKLTVEQVVRIREESAAGATLGFLAEKYQITFGRVGAIVRGDSWKSAGGPLTKRGLDHARRPR